MGKDKQKTCSSLISFSLKRTIHLDQKFCFDSPACFMLFRCSPAAAHGVDLVDKDGSGSIEPCLDARKADRVGHYCSRKKRIGWSLYDVQTHHFEQQAHKFLRLPSVFGGECGGRDVEESCSAFCSYSFCQQGFARTWGADHQHALIKMRWTKWDSRSSNQAVFLVM